MAVKDYDQRLVQLWADGANTPGGLALDFTSDGESRGLKTAVTKRAVMYRLRKEMVKEGHAFSKLASKCKISLKITLGSGKIIFYSKEQTWTDAEVSKVELVIIPLDDDKEMDAVLEKAGYQQPKAPSFD